ncbi:MAG: Hint domain-containing protein [Halocynthiibacter sp.]
MNYLVRSTTAIAKPRPWTVSRPELQYSKPKELDIVTRRYGVEWLDQNGDAQSRTMVAAAMPFFEAAFSAFAQGTLIQTGNGNVAVEDLRPGDKVASADGGLQPLMWVGSMTHFPQQAEMGLPSSRLYRITENIFGLDRSAPDLMLGAAARILPGLFAINSSSRLVDIDELADGHSVIRVLPISAVRTFHLGLAGHRLIRANGIVVESFHPGEHLDLRLAPDMLNLFMSLFPHIKEVGDFGPLRHKRND